MAAQKRHGVFRPEKHFAAHPSSFPFLLDEDREVTKSYGVWHRLGKDAINIARPATFVVERTGKIQFQYVGEDQKDRAAIEQVMEALEAAA